MVFRFLYSRTARSALGCSREQLTQILTHYQVMAPFLDFVFTFRVREEPETLAAFRSKDCLQEANSLFTNPKLERSGLRIQHCFNLISVEYDETQEEWPWPLRQTATYHSFDPVNGRAFWISLKGNDEVSNRLKKSIPVHPQLRSSALKTVEARFTATLLTHLILFHWCVENWPKHIDFLEGRVKEQLDKVRLGPVTAMTAPEKIERAALRRLTMNNSIGTAPPSRQATIQKTHSFQAPKLVKRVSERLFPEKKSQNAHPKEQKKKDIDLDFDQLYNFDELQNLGQLGDDMHQSLLVIGQNTSVMKEIMARYSALLASPNFKLHVDTKACQTDLENFLSRSQQLVRGMENNAVRLENIIGNLESAKDQVSTSLVGKNSRGTELTRKKSSTEFSSTETSARASTLRKANMIRPR